MSGLRPFFCFYGGKWRNAMRYPAPAHATIIEPFAGSAGYSLRYPQRDVVLCDIDGRIAGLWSYLIKASADEIMALPDLEDDQTVDDLRLCEPAKTLIGFWLNKGVAQPRKSPSRWMRDGIHPGSFWGPTVRSRIAGQLHAIRHWVVVHGSYKAVTNRTATWFIDPPYVGAGSHYRFGSSLIDYDHLADWSRSRYGQVIACENVGASWLPFRAFMSAKTARRSRSEEAVWHLPGARVSP